MEFPKIVLKPGEVCPCCGHKKRGGWKNAASAKNGLKGGKPHELKGGRPKGSKNKPK